MTEYTLTLESFGDGVKAFMEDPFNRIYVQRDFEAGAYRIDLGEIDASAADIILQYALFGEPVFG